MRFVSGRPIYIQLSIMMIGQYGQLRGGRGFSFHHWVSHFLSLSKKTPQVTEQ